jgi:hypothetical protein
MDGFHPLPWSRTSYRPLTMAIVKERNVAETPILKNRIFINFRSFEPKLFWDAFYHGSRYQRSCWLSCRRGSIYQWRKVVCLFLTLRTPKPWDLLSHSWYCWCEGAPKFFSNVYIQDARVIEYWIIFSLKI